LQTRRSNRWAQTQTREAEIMNGSILISVRRLIVLGASLVCKVEKSICPVGDDQ
jgi:hypothetical protein